MKFSNIFKHFFLILRHKAKVFRNCARCGIIFRGIVHDMSKFSPAEFFESARHYQGNRSPIGACRRATGVSYAWLHHKGRNKHHLEYWVDEDCQTPPLVPYKYAVECLCDKIAATKTYLGKEYTNERPYLHWKRYGDKVKANTKTMAFIEQAFIDLAKKGEDAVLNRAYMRATYDKFCS